MWPEIETYSQALGTLVEQCSNGIKPRHEFMPFVEVGEIQVATQDIWPPGSIKWQNQAHAARVQSDGGTDLPHGRHGWSNDKQITGWPVVESEEKVKEALD